MLLAVLAILCLTSPATAQSFSQPDWRPEDRTLIGDFSRISAIATSLDRVYIVSPSALLIWNPQFRRGRVRSILPPASLLARVFTGLADPLDNSLWLARPDGWVHYQPEMQLWDQGCGDGWGASPSPSTRTIPPAASLSAPGATGSCCPAAARCRCRPRPPGATRCGGVGRGGGPQQPHAPGQCGAILMDRRLRNVRYTAAARAFDNPGWYLGTSGDRAAVPGGRCGAARAAPLRPAIDRVGAVFSWPGGVWVGTNRTPLADASLTFVGERSHRIPTLSGPRPLGLPFDQVRELAGQGKAIWAATDLGVVRIDPARRPDRADRRWPWAARQPGVRGRRRGRAGSRSARARARPDRTIAPGRAGGAVLLRRRATPSFPAGDSVWVGTPRGLLLALPGQEDLVRPAAWRPPALQAPVVALATLGDTVVALTRDQHRSGAIRGPAAGHWVPISPVCSAASCASLPTARASGWRASGASGSLG